MGTFASHVQLSRRAVRSLQLRPAALTCCPKSRLNPWDSLDRMANKGTCQGTCKVRTVTRLKKLRQQWLEVLGAQGLLLIRPQKTSEHAYDHMSCADNTGQGRGTIYTNIF